VVIYYGASVPNSVQQVAGQQYFVVIGGDPLINNTASWSGGYLLWRFYALTPVTVDLWLLRFRVDPSPLEWNLRLVVLLTVSCHQRSRSVCYCPPSCWGYASNGLLRHFTRPASCCAICPTPLDSVEIKAAQGRKLIRKLIKPGVLGWMISARV